VLIGTARYDGLPDLPAVQGNLEELSRLLSDPDLWGVPAENMHVLLDEADPATISSTVRRAAREVGGNGLLLIYFAGHGLVDPIDGKLVLALPGTDPAVPHERGLAFDWIRLALLTTAAPRRIVILDCCYGGRAGSDMAAEASPADAVAVRALIEKTCLLVAASANRRATAPEGEPYTAFTGELIRTLRAGLPSGSATLTVEEIWQHVRQSLDARGLERPELRERNAGGHIPLVRNAQRPSEDLTGTILYAAPGFSDPELRHSAVLVLRHNSTGALGVRLGRAAGPLPADFPASWLPLMDQPAVLFDGGPVARDGYIVVARLHSGVPEPLRFTPVRDRLGTLALSGVPQDITPSVKGLRVFAGYLGWGPEELEGYLADRSLLRSTSTLSRVLAASPVNAWYAAWEGR
jgi:putative AlgH/UPF0301 family transcriptional regulator